MNLLIYRDQIFDNLDDFLQVHNDYAKESFSNWKIFDSSKKGVDEENIKVDPKSIASSLITSGFVAQNGLQKAQISD